METPETRLTLINKLRNPQDVQAWEDFHDIYQPLIFRICLSKGLQHADATDVTQEVLLRVTRAIESYRHQQAGATFRGWLHRITRNLVIDHFRKQGADPMVVASENRLDEVLASEPNADETQAFQIEFQRQMFVVASNEVCTQVKPQTWQAFWKTEVEHLPVEAVADLLGMTKGAIYVARSRVIARIRKAVEQRMQETTG